MDNQQERGETRFNVGASYAPTGRLLTTIEVSSHRTLFDFFRRFSSDSNTLYEAQMDMLLGVYCNTLSLVRFLELGLSVACVCTRFPELTYVNDGTIQFETQQPMIARDGPHPADQPVHNYMTKSLDRRSLNAAFSIAAEALGLLSGVSFDGTQIAEHLRTRAIQQLARNINAVLDSFERGSADQMLRILLEKAPPLALLGPLSRYLDEGRLSNQVARANLISELKRRVCEDSFFMSKYVANRDAIMAQLSQLVSSTRPSVAVQRLTHSDTSGRPVDGVIVTTATVRQRLLSLLNMADNHANVPVTYGEMVVTGSNLVTAVVMGRAVRNLEDVARHLLNLRDDRILKDKDGPINTDDDDTPRMARVRADLAFIGEKLVFIESLERRIYQATNVSYPLIGTIDLTFVMPLGLFKPLQDNYARHAGDYAPGAGQVDTRSFPPRQILFYNKDGQLIKLTLEDAIGTVCHPSFLEIDMPLDFLRATPRDLRCPFGAYVAVQTQEDLAVSMRRFFDRWLDYMPDTPSWVAVETYTVDQMLSPGNSRLPFELHPAFDFFIAPADINLPGPANIPQVMATVNATWRVCNCNIPLPLCPSNFRDARGQEICSNRHRMSQATIDAVRSTFADVNYPTVFYIIEAIVHGSERMFGILMRLIMQCIRGYWANGRRVAFINNFPMVMYINTYLGNGELPEECASVYREIVDHLLALRRVITDYTLHADNIGRQGQEELNNIMADQSFLPPLIWDGDALIYRYQAEHDRNAAIIVGGEEGFTLRPFSGLNDINFDRTGNSLIHNAHIRADAGNIQHTEPHHDAEWVILNKLYYFVMVPTFSRGRCCTMGINYNRVYATAQAVIIPDLAADEEPPIGPDDARHPLNARHLVPNSINVLFHNARIVVDSDALLTLQESVHEMAERTTAILSSTGPDFGAATVGTRLLRTYDGTLHHGLLMMAYPRNDETVAAGTFFYPAPVHALFAYYEHIAAFNGLPRRVHQTARRVPPVPIFLGANYYATIRQPVLRYVTESRADENALSYALLAGYFKLSPVSLLHQLRTGLHPGFAFTVVRQDRFVTENMLFAEKASESYFMGQLQVSRHASAGGITFTLTQPRANVDLGTGFTAVHTSPLLRTPLTDMGNATQNLFLTRGSVPMIDADADDFIRRGATAGQRLAPRYQVPFMGTILPSQPSGLDHGQQSVCEFIATPVSVDINYFRAPCNPRGRASGSAYAGEGDNDIRDVMYDHSQGDPSYPFRATNNPWASQEQSYGDRLFNGKYNLSGASQIYSPCYKFFTPAEVEGKRKCLLKMVLEAGSALAMFPGDTETQFKRPRGSTELTEDPCGLFQEAYPILCSTDQALLRTVGTSDIGGAETHLAQYLIRDASPIKGCLPM
ncbi:UL19 [anatid alphaherpesvirus 1]|nr:UL19 [Anatid alphaherpesvirus 1]